MRIGTAVRRWAAPLGATLGAAAVCIACSSTTVGSPASTGGGGVSLGSLPAPSISAPSLSGLPSGLPSISGLPSLGGSEADTAFCKDATDIDPSSLTSDPSGALALYDKLAADAPDQIKGDVEKIRDFLHSVVNGNADSSDAQNVGPAAANLGTYIAEHCVSS